MDHLFPACVRSAVRTAAKQEALRSILANFPLKIGTCVLMERALIFGNLTNCWRSIGGSLLVVYERLSLRVHERDARWITCSVIYSR